MAPRDERNLGTPPHDGDHFQHIGFHHRLGGPMPARQDGAIELHHHQLGLVAKSLQQALQGQAGGRGSPLPVDPQGDRLSHPPQPSSPTRASRRAELAALGSAAAVIARTTATRRAPAATTAARLLGSMPPIAKKGTGHAAAAAAT